MQWKHKCSYAWLKARQGYLTASDVHKLAPLTKSGRVRKVSQEDYEKLLMEKTQMVVPEDCVSTGAAARGHWMEPQVVDYINEYKLLGPETYFHWDDALVYRDYMAFSPDALTVEQPDGDVEWECEELVVSAPIKLAEIKCYSTKRHVEAVLTPGSMLEERWQVATAMWVDERIDSGSIVFFCPECMWHPVHVARYSREDLKEEIEIIGNIEKVYFETLEYSNHYDPSNAALAYLYKAEAACKSWIEEEEYRTEGLNPSVS